MGTKYYTSELRPKIFAYWQIAKKRPTIDKITIHAIRNVIKVRVMRKLKKVMPVIGGVTAVGLAAGLAFAFAKKKLDG